MLGLAKGSKIVTLEAHRYRRYRLAVRVGRVTDAALDFALWAHNQGLSDTNFLASRARLREGQDQRFRRRAGGGTDLSQTGSGIA